MIVREMMFGTDESFAYAECSDCGTLWLEAVPENLGDYYRSDYYSVEIDPAVAIGRPGVRQFATLVARSVLFGEGRLGSLARVAVPMRQFRSFVTVLRSVALAGLPEGRRTRVLDVGCGSGIITYALALAGVGRSVGVDPFAPGDRMFDNGAQLLRRDLADVDGEFDLVMFHHSFEHVPDPSASLAAAASVLAPGGRILIRMPTRSSEAFEEYGAEWVQMDAPRHLTLFSREGMRTLADRHGFDIVTTVDDSSSFQFWGSEQVRRGIPLISERSQMISPKRSVFSSDQVSAWERRAAELNASGRGDQAIWVLRAR